MSINLLTVYNIGRNGWIVRLMAIENVYSDLPKSIEGLFPAIQHVGPLDTASK